MGSETLVPVTPGLYEQCWNLSPAFNRWSGLGRPERSMIFTWRDIRVRVYVDHDAPDVCDSLRDIEIFLGRAT